MLLAGSSAAQELSTLVFPSEDEVYEALELGLIDSADAAALIETLQFGIGQGSMHRFDLIPNLSSIYGTNGDLYDMIRFDQVHFLKDIRRKEKNKISGEAWYENYQELNEKNRSRYRSGLRMFANEHWQVSARINREYSGIERFVNRRLSYRSREGVVRELIIGSFSRRYGLGAAIGYRGKLFDYSDEIDGESLLYPDYGGFNGLHAEIESGRVNAMMLVSSLRDSDYRLATFGEFVTFNFGKTQLGVVGVHNRLTNRSDNSTFDDLKVGLFGFHDYSGGKFAIEAALQGGDRQSFGGIVIEGDNYFEFSRFRYSLWHYNDSYVDLTSGSKSASIRHDDYLDEPGFEYSTRRSGQSGILIKDITPILTYSRLSNSLLAAWLNSDTVLIEMVSAVEHDFTSSPWLRVDYSNKLLKFSSGEQYEHKGRAEMRINSGRYRFRTYIGYSRRADGTEYLLLFGSCNVNTGPFDRLRFWIDLSRMNLESSALDYAYAYVEHVKTIESWLTGRVKLSERYYRQASEKYLTTLSFELTLLI